MSIRPDAARRAPIAAVRIGLLALALAGASVGAGVRASAFVDSLKDLHMHCDDVHERISGGRKVDHAIDFDGEADRTLDFLGAVNAVINHGRPTEDPFAWLHPVSAWQGAAIQPGIWESPYDTDAWSPADGRLRASDMKGSTASWVRQFFDQIGEARLTSTASG